MKAFPSSRTATAGLYSALKARRRRSAFASLPAWAASLFLLVMVHPSPAQWLTQTIKLTSGWNAVYPHVDLSHTTLANLVGADPNNPVEEVWQWRPAPSTVQFIENPQTPTEIGSQWASWSRATAETSNLRRLIGNAAYLVRLRANVPSYDWQLKGKPLSPAYKWTTTGLNFVAFPTSPDQAPTFEQFLAHAPELQQNAEIYRYIGGDLGPANPARVFAFRTIPVQRGQAYWIRSGSTFNRYFAPFEIELSGSRGTDLGTSGSVCGIRLRNLTAGALGVTLRLVPSEPAPSGEANIVGTPPLLLRGSLDPTNFIYGSESLNAGSSKLWTLTAKGQPGSEVEVVIGLNRFAMSGAPGDLLAAVLRVTDSLGHAQVDLPISATVAPSHGLWVGRAVLTEVAAYLKEYARDAENDPVTSAEGPYVVTGLNTNLGSVGRHFPLQLVLHNPEPGNKALLLQRVYCGFDSSTNVVVANQESALHPAHRDIARRISVTHLPWTEANEGWAFSGNLANSASLTATVLLDYDDHASNPFLHTYHPDHDNRDATFRKVLPQGSESYSVRREITLAPIPPANDFASLTSSGQNMSGIYSEQISVLGLTRDGGAIDTRQFHVRGIFKINRLLGASTLTKVP